MDAQPPVLKAVRPGLCPVPLDPGRDVALDVGQLLGIQPLGVEAAQVGLVGLAYLQMPRVFWKELEESAVPGQRAVAVVKRTQRHVQTIQGVAQGTDEAKAGIARHGQKVRYGDVDTGPRITQPQMAQARRCQHTTHNGGRSIVRSRAYGNPSRSGGPATSW